MSPVSRVPLETVSQLPIIQIVTVVPSFNEYCVVYVTDVADQFQTFSSQITLEVTNLCAH